MSLPVSTDRARLCDDAMGLDSLLFATVLDVAEFLRVASGLGLAASGVIAIHQRSICRAETGSPGLGPSVLLCARCVLYTVLRVEHT